MGKRGPPPQPSILKYIRGNPSKESLPTDEPTPDLLEEGFDAPDYVREDSLALRKWNEAVTVLRRMRVMTEADVETLARYCDVWAHWMRMREKCRQVGREIMHFEPDPNRTDGKLRIRWAQPAPWAVDEKAARKDLLQMEREFGMTPSSRSQVSIHSNAQDDPLAAFVRKRSDRAGA